MRWPRRSLVEFRLFHLFMSATVTPYLDAILPMVSPRRTLCHLVAVPAAGAGMLTTARRDGHAAARDLMLSSQDPDSLLFRQLPVNDGQQCDSSANSQPEIEKAPVTAPPEIHTYIYDGHIKFDHHTSGETCTVVRRKSILIHGEFVDCHADFRTEFED